MVKINSNDMKPTDLRIGNLIHYPKWNAYGESDVFSVRELDSYNQKLDLTNGVVHLPSCDLLIVKPIQITEQWLEGLGFKVYGATSPTLSGWAIGETPYLLTLTCMKNYDGTLDGCFYDDGHYEVKYVHQLQNIFHSLTEEELELNPDFKTQLNAL